MNANRRKPLQFGLKWLFGLTLAAGIVAWLLSARLPAELVFVLLALPMIIALWFALSRLVSSFIADLFD